VPGRATRKEIRSFDKETDSKRKYLRRFLGGRYSRESGERNRGSKKRSRDGRVDLKGVGWRWCSVGSRAVLGRSLNLGFLAWGEEADFKDCRTSTTEFLDLIGFKSTVKWDSLIICR
jgi:hypothetical protein